MAQSVEQRIRNAWVRGSNPLGSFLLARRYIFSCKQLIIETLVYERKEEY